MNFSFVCHETTKLGPQRIMVKSSEVSSPSFSGIVYYRTNETNETMFVLEIT